MSELVLFACSQSRSIPGLEGGKKQYDFAGGIFEFIDETYRKREGGEGTSSRFLNSSGNFPIAWRKTETNMIH